MFWHTFLTWVKFITIKKEHPLNGQDHIDRKAEFKMRLIKQEIFGKLI